MIPDNRVPNLNIFINNIEQKPFVEYPKWPLELMIPCIPTQLMSKEQYNAFVKSRGWE